MASSVNYVEALIDGDRPSQRGGHSAVTADNQIVIFGGSSYLENGRFAYMNDTYVLDAKSRAWHKVPCSGEHPSARYGHSVELVGSRMFVFGGRGPSGVLRDTFFLDLVEWTWVPVSVTSASPAPRFFHASLLVGRKIVVHGGWDGRTTCLGDLWVFNTDSFTWLQPRTVGLAPSPRYGHTLELLNDGRILCFGGASVTTKDPVPQYYNDLRSLDTETMVWTKPPVGGDLAPSGRYGMRSAQLEEGVVFYGGWGVGGIQNAHCKRKNAGSVHLLRVGTDHDPQMSWLRPTLPAAPPAHKYGHTMTVIGATLYIFGGWNGKQACNDLIELSLTH
ncbi:hypothetical protein CTAYLR_005337 [Chrysophaeum taylorii]|uniref:Uncharacterized protein n=1 Tax=Chrysophaeum taylorii TaxID=2483200 RepID=A0AAD7XIF8_9STRA|nr:hypothetical protein CTAYLR_005337 [Chrysophaeum taylorii]